jgi:hypothetical protein
MSDDLDEAMRLLRDAMSLIESLSQEADEEYQADIDIAGDSVEEAIRRLISAKASCE